MKRCDGMTAAVLLPMLLGTACLDLAAEEKGFAESSLARARSALQAARDEDERAAREKTVENTIKVMGDIAAAGVWQNSPIACYAVPPVSSIKRLPDVIPPDGELRDAVSVFAAKGEFEPASFVIVPFADFEKVELRVTDLLGEAGSVIRADAVDLRVVKCWYQAGTARHSYFGDPMALPLKLAPTERNFTAQRRLPNESCSASYTLPCPPDAISRTILKSPKDGDLSDAIVGTLSGRRVGVSAILGRAPAGPNFIGVRW